MQISRLACDFFITNRWQQDKERPGLLSAAAYSRFLTALGW